MASSGSSETPLMKQYHAIKSKYPGALLLFRVGDFYETFGEDAVKASKILDITLTKRNNGTASEIELAGFPYHALDAYLPKLVRAGQRVAICDQLEDPKSVKGIVKRGVTELVTPGVSYNDNVLDVKQNNYLAALQISKGQMGIALLDISTGEFMTAQGEKNYIEKLMQSFHPSEVLFPKNKKEEFFSAFGEDHTTYALDDWIFNYDYAYENLTTHFGTNSLKGFGIEELREGITAAGAVLHYLDETEHKDKKHIQNLSRIEEEKFVWLDRFTIRNLELIYPQHTGGTALIHILDKTLTPMGARTLRKWMVLPLKEKTPIEDRLRAVEEFISDGELRLAITEHLKHIGDLERLISKVAVRRINPREMGQLKRALIHSIPVRECLTGGKTEGLEKFATSIDPCESLIDKISHELKDELPVVINQGNMIREGIDPELDELRKIAFSGKDYLIRIQQREIERTGISSLKIAYNKVFGYYLEVTNTHKDKVPSDWIRKQTLVNAERYITEELKSYEEKILHAEEKIGLIEQRIFLDLVEQTGEFVTQIQQNARTLGLLDALLSFAEVSVTNQYVRPEIQEGNALSIKKGRHPVIEKQLPFGEEYVPNDIFLDDEYQQIIIITGPNMAGKSALLRQTALIVLMAQMGCFVPAESAEIGLIDKVFTRVGASDNLSRGESTFMVEMTETASILNNLSDRSLILMDEIGRGTSTYDGVSIAWAIVEYLHNNLKFRPKTLFATHYHELNLLSQDFPRIKNYNVSVKELGNKVLFLRKLKEGGSRHSFGIHVAQMAGMPNPVVFRANEILKHLEKDKNRTGHDELVSEIPKNNFQLSLFEPADPRFEKVKTLLDELDINAISPVEALLKLNEIKLLLKEPESAQK